MAGAHRRGGTGWAPTGATTAEGRLAVPRGGRPCRPASGVGISRFWPAAVLSCVCVARPGLCQAFAGERRLADAAAEVALVGSASCCISCCVHACVVRATLMVQLLEYGCSQESVFFPQSALSIGSIQEHSDQHVVFIMRLGVLIN